MQSDRASTSRRNLTIADVRSATGPHYRTVRHDASFEPRAGIDLSGDARSGAPVGDGAVAFAARPGALVWKPDHPRDNRVANLISAAALLHAGMGSNSNSAWPNDSLSVAGAHRKHPRYAHSYWDR